MPQKRKSFGVDDTPACSKCGAGTFVARRSPHPDTPDLEVQIIACKSCDHEEPRVANSDGAIFPYNLKSD